MIRIPLNQAVESLIIQAVLILLIVWATIQIGFSIWVFNECDHIANDTKIGVSK